MGIKIPTFTPKLKQGTYNQGIRVERWQPDRPRQGHKLYNFGMGWERAGQHGSVRPQRLEVRKAEREFEAGNDDAFDDVRDMNERAEAGATADNISQLRKHLARRKGQKFEPTGSVSNSPYDLKGGDLGVPSWGVVQRGIQPKRQLLKEARSRAKARQWSRYA